MGRLEMVSRIVIGVLLLGLVFLGFVASFSYLDGESRSGKNAELTAGTEVSLGIVHSVDWGNMKEYVFEYDCMKDAKSPNNSRAIDDMRILEVMTLITYKGLVYAVLAPVGEIWSFDGQSWNVTFIWNTIPHPVYKWRGGAWAALVFEDVLYFFGYIMHDDGRVFGCGIRFDGSQWSFKECYLLAEFYAAEVFQNKIYCAGNSGVDTCIFNVDPDTLNFTLVHVEPNASTPAFMSANRWTGELYVATGCWEHGERNIPFDEIYAHLLVFDNVSWHNYGLSSEEGFESVTVDSQLGVVVGASSGTIYSFSNGSFTREYDLGNVHPIKMFGPGGNIGKDWFFDCLWICGGSRWYYKPIAGETLTFREGKWHKLLDSIAVGFSDVETFGSWVLISTVWPRDHTRVSILVFPVTYFTNN
jgi:hypothetical protein